MRLMPVVLAAIAAAAALPAHAWRDAPPDGRTLRCESEDGRTRECAADATGGARLLRQVSKAPCIEGESWGRTRHSIWVTQGCRGEFLAVSSGNGYGYDDRYGRGRPDGRLLQCASEDGRWKHCGADVRRGVDLVRQMSRNPCIRGQSWGTDGGGIWVNGGCRAEFRVGEAGRWTPPPAAATRFRCESGDGRPRTCGVPARGDVRFVRQVSRAPCIEGQSWGMSRDGVWVDGGCRAEFEVLSAWADNRW